ncbi:hypothetical protein Hanom_Chr16g01459951 [Helianthus anomalus]
MSWFILNYVFGNSSDNTITFISETSVEGSVVPNSYNGRVIDDHGKEPDFPSGNYGYGCRGYNDCYGASYGQDNYGNNFLISDASYVQEHSYAQEPLGNE